MNGAWIYTLIPVAAMGIGAAGTTIRQPGPMLTSSVQHFAAGVVFAAAAAEILPDLKHAGAALPLFVGSMIGVGFAAGSRQGLVLTLALTLEVLFLGVNLAIRLGEGTRSRLQVIAVTVGIGLLLPLGALFGGPIATLPPAAVTGFFAFGLVALLYLVTEELLVEAHEVPETPLITAMFFVGFLSLILIEDLL